MELIASSSQSIKDSAKSNKPLVYKCNTCDKAFAQNYLLRKHLEIHLGVKAHECNVCGKSYFRRDRLNRHLLTHSEEKPYSCEICSKGFVSHPELLIHMRVHPGETFHCTKCDEGFTDLRLFKAHYKAHLDDRLYNCTECGRSFKSVGHLRQHATIHQPGGQQYSCPQCPRTFTLKSGFDAHVLMHELQYKRRQTCDVCGMKFSRRSDLSDHMLIHRKEETNDGDDSIRCSKCSVAFKSYELLSQHCKKMHAREKGMKPPPQDCTLCEEVCDNVYDLEHHVVMVHPQHETFVCVECDERFQRVTTLQDHMLTEHEVEPGCMVCGTKFLDVRLLRDHITGENSIESGDSSAVNVCNECCRVFETSKQLQRHLLTHTEGKTMTCDVCGETFTQRKQYQLHMTSHEKSALYTCSQCDCVFNCAYSRRTHIVRMHADPSNRCSECAQYSLGSSQSTDSTINSESANSSINSKPYMNSKNGLMGINPNGKSKGGSRQGRMNSEAPWQHMEAEVLCPNCDEGFNDVVALSIHTLLGTCGSKTSMHACDSCGMRFNSASALHYHSAVHMATDLESTYIDEPDYVCYKCSAGFHSPFHLRGHLLAHEDEQDVVCPVCDRPFDSISSWTEHIHRHTVLRPYPCDCGESFADRRQLRRHQRSCRMYMLCLEANEIAIRVNQAKEKGINLNAANGRSVINGKCNDTNLGYNVRGGNMQRDGISNYMDVDGADVARMTLQNICGVCLRTFEQFGQLCQHMKSHAE